MKYLFEGEEEERETLGRRSAARRTDSPETEITLGTRSILSIFFGLVLICAVFFGLGYSVGRGSTVRLLAETAPSEPAATQESHIAKPSAQQSLSAVEPAPAETGGEQAAGSKGAGSQEEAGAAEPRPVPAEPSPAVLSSVKPAAGGNPARVENEPASSAGSSAAPALQRTAGVQNALTASSYMVQIAAVRIPEDANILVKALKEHGYTASARNEPQDQLLHIQLGPFTSRAEANTMRARLIADGYNAVVK